MDKYKQVYEQEWIRIPFRGHKDACCDCGLVHVINYRLVEGTLEMQVEKIDKRATSARRRKKGLKCQSSSDSSSSAGS